MSKIRTILPKLCISVFLILNSTPVKAQITPDNTLGAERSVFTPNTLVQGKGINADLITGGAQRERNLFHSFSDFNVKAGQSVYFANSSDVTNILTRVTGGNPSNILGTLGVDGTANLFLINPAGILFGKNATLDLKGSFVGTTANGVQFGNLGSFSATNPQAPPLLMINPSALLFNQLNQGATITNQSIAGANATGLQVLNGKSLLLVGGDVILDGGGLTANGGRVELASLAAPGTIGLNVAGDTLSLSVPSDVQRGNISLQNQAQVDVTSGGGGDIAVNAGNLAMSNSSILFAGIGTGLGTGSKAGNINVNIDTISLSNGSRIDTSNSGKGTAGNITIIAKGTATFDGVDSGGFPSGLFTVVRPGGVGNAGNININTGSLSVTNGAQIDSFTSGRGNAGNITITANNAVTFYGATNGYQSGIFSDVTVGGIGNGGNINITSNSLSLTNGGQLNANLNGDSQTFSGALGNAGNINLNLSDYLLLRNGSQIAASAGTQRAGGNGGNITINSPFIVAVPNENSDIIANAYSGFGGNININAGLLGIQPTFQLSFVRIGNNITASPQYGNLISGLVAPPIQLSDVTTKFSQLCPNTANPKKKPLGSFVITGRGSIPPNPLELLPGRNPDIPLANAEDMQEIKAIQAQEQKKKEEQEHNTKVGRKKNKDNTFPSIVEAQGIVQTPDGQIYFVANANHATPSSQPTASPCPSEN